MTHRFGLIAASGLILASLIAGLLAMPSVEARTDPTVWTTTSLGGLTGVTAVLNVQLANEHGSEKMGLAYRQGTDAHFWRCDTNCLVAASWTQKQADVTGATAFGGNMKLAWAGGNHWVIMALMAGNQLTTYHSSDDGATWTAGGASFFGTCSGCVVFDLASDTAYIYSLTGVAGSPLGFQRSVDYGVTWTDSQTISDNTPGSASIGVNSASFFGAESPGAVIGVAFQENAISSDVYYVTGDGVFFSVAYNPPTSSTRNPTITTGTSATCPKTSAATTQGGVVAAGTATDPLFYAPLKNGANNQYLCSLGAGIFTAYPSAAPATRNDNWANGATSSPTGGSPLASNNNGQFIAAGRQATNNYVLYKASSGAAAWTLAYTATNADSAEFSVETSPTKAYFIFTDANFANRLTIAGATMIPDVLGTGKIFCATKDEDTNFGYDDQGGATDALSGGDVIDMQGSNSNPAWLGKSWGGVNPSPSGIHAARVFFTIRANDEGLSSKFRATFTNTPASGTIATPTLNDGDKDHTGDFANSVDAFFQETGNQWTVKFYYTTGGGARTQFGSSFVGDAPNTATQYMLEVNTEASTSHRYLALKYDNSTDVPGMNVTIPVEAGKDNAFWYEQWFIAESTNVLVVADTDLTNSGLSTCIFGLGAASVPAPNGDSGRVVSSGSITGSGSASSTCDSFLCTDASTVPEGFTVTAFNGFMGLILVATIAVGGSTAIFSGDTKGRGFGLVFGTFAIVGYLIGLYFELLPLWPLIVLAVVAGAVVLLKIRSRTD